MESEDFEMCATIQRWTEFLHMCDPSLISMYIHICRYADILLYGYYAYLWDLMGQVYYGMLYARQSLVLIAFEYPHNASQYAKIIKDRNKCIYSLDMFG